MRTTHKIFACVLILTLEVVANAKEWRGLIPLHSTRADAQRLLGQATEETTNSAAYYTGKESVYIVFSSADTCAALPADTVLQIQVTPKTFVRLIDLQIDERRLPKVNNDHQYREASYLTFADDHEGMIVHTFKGRVREIWFTANYMDKQLCPKYYRDEEVGLAPDHDQPGIKFDEYEDLSFEQEKRRLDNFAFQLRSAPALVGYIIAYSGRGTGIDAKARADRAKDYLVRVGRVDLKRLF